MRFLTLLELRQWCASQGIRRDNENLPICTEADEPDDQGKVLKCALPTTVGQVTSFCDMIEGFLRPREHCLLRVALLGMASVGELALILSTPAKLL
jgi:hypothetical protein